MSRTLGLREDRQVAAQLVAQIAGLFPFEHRCYRSNVGAGLSAMALVQPTDASADTLSLRASPLPQWACGAV